MLNRHRSFKIPGELMSCLTNKPVLNESSLNKQPYHHHKTNENKENHVNNSLHTQCNLCKGTRGYFRKLFQAGRLTVKIGIHTG